MLWSRENAWRDGYRHAELGGERKPPEGDYTWRAREAWLEGYDVAVAETQGQAFMAD